MAIDKNLINGILIPQLNAARNRYLDLAEWNTGAANQPTVTFTGKVGPEQKQLSDIARLDFATLVVRSASQPLSVDGVTTAAGESDEEAWKFWQEVNMGYVEKAIYEESLRYGEAYLLHDKTAFGTKRVLPYSAIRAQGFYENPFDRFPTYAVVIERLPSDKNVVWENDEKYTEYTVYDDRKKYQLKRSEDMDAEWELSDGVSHGFNHTPLVRYFPYIDINGYTTGDIENNIDLFKTINMRAFNANLNLHYQSFMIRYATGITLPGKVDLGNGQTWDPTAHFKEVLSQGSFMFDKNPEAKFGSLPYTPFDGFEAALDQAIRILASVTQTTPGLLLGEIQGTSAEMASVVSQSNRNKLEALQGTFGESHKSSFMLGTGRKNTVDINVQWKSIDNVSVAAITDALGKQAQMLGAPKTEVWKDLPDMSPSKHAQWVKARDEQLRLEAELSNAITEYSKSSSAIPEEDPEVAFEG